MWAGGGGSLWPSAQASDTIAEQPQPQPADETTSRGLSIPPKVLQGGYFGSQVDEKASQPDYGGPADNREFEAERGFTFPLAALQGGYSDSQVDKKGSDQLDSDDDFGEEVTTEEGLRSLIAFVRAARAVTGMQADIAKALHIFFKDEEDVESLQCCLRRDEYVQDIRDSHTKLLEHRSHQVLYPTVLGIAAVLKLASPGKVAGLVAAIGFVVKEGELTSLVDRLFDRLEDEKVKNDEIKEILADCILNCATLLTDVTAALIEVEAAIAQLQAKIRNRKTDEEKALVRVKLKKADDLLTRWSASHRAVLKTTLFAAPPAPAAIAAEPGAAPSGGGPGGFTNVAGSQDDEKAQPASLQLGSRARFVGPEHIGADLDLAWGTEVVLRDERDGLYFVVRGTQNGGGAWIAGIHLSAVGTQAVATPERAELRLLKAIQQGDPATLSAITVGKKYAQNEVHLSSKPQCKPVFNSKDNFLPEFQEKFLRDLQKDFQEIPPDRSCINMVGRGDITQAGNEILDFMRKRKGAEIYKVRPEKYWCSGRDYADGLDFTWKIRMYPREDGAKAETQHRGGDVVGYCNWVKEVRRHFQNAPVSKAKKIVVANDGKWIPDDLLKQIAQERMAKMAASADAMTDDPASKKMQGLQEKGAFG
eukprot:TRINITY_DN8217_c0_g2_i6.p1 TRINITY_DN8217_c0_g2~~TRINITY_DN8217_c0_g2_i6.p1  ORF type:complete len:647 (+),score=134.52 TRINITY_DN8217_c0_g2_i6:88-2028(+)